MRTHSGMASQTKPGEVVSWYKYLEVVNSWRQPTITVPIAHLTAQQNDFHNKPYLCVVNQPTAEMRTIAATAGTAAVLHCCAVVLIVTVLLLFYPLYALAVATVGAPHLCHPSRRLPCQSQLLRVVTELRALPSPGVRTGPPSVCVETRQTTQTPPTPAKSRCNPNSKKLSFIRSATEIENTKRL